ncbi:helix-turn-helix transcriptional regulator [Mesorhizobium sp.]|uniref:helix-turn-helix domain-containing protein n=1 Tax=Mesorhizobium sp. TaxID=1871066 RepID=UPI0025838A1A|nr:helix-turn-helix transcriptional regulator [Mesorhizobium sp.]
MPDGSRSTARRGFGWDNNMRNYRDLHAAEEALEDAADAAIYDERKADLKTEKPLPADVTMEILQGSSRLKALRNWRRLTQAELAATIGVSQGFLSDLESNRRKPSAQTRAMLAKALDIPGQWIEP